VFVDNNEQAQAMRVTMRLLLSMVAAAIVAMTGPGAYAQGTPEGDALFQDPGSGEGRLGLRDVLQETRIRLANLIRSFSRPRA
jgi:hypothetical protein